MRLRTLGCSGGIGPGLRTTSFLLDDDILIDAGTGVGDLTLDEMRRIDHVFVTHAHLDHIATIPFLVDTVGSLRDRPMLVHATAPTLAVLRDHVFNWQVWPDFTRIPDRERPFMQYRTLEIGQTIELDGRRITPIPANHVVPTVGYVLDSGAASLVFSGDTTTNDALWQAVNGLPNLRYLIVETAFRNKERELAVASKHFCPDLLAEDLRKLARPDEIEIYITHLKPTEIDVIMQELGETIPHLNPRMLDHGRVFEF